jgi:hypothetical protein
MMRTRRRTLLVIAGVALVSLGLGIVAGSRIHSTADAASRVSAPEASAITVPVELRVLETEVITRGDVAFAGATEVTLELGDLGTPPVITGQVPERGDELAEGEPLLEVVGRPVLALEGELPMYRSLRPGMSGPDVEQLKQALRRLGYDPGAADDRYTAATAGAVAQLFRDAGYDPPEPDEQARTEVTAAEEAVDLAEEALSSAQAALDAAEDGGSGPERAAARAQVDAARGDLADAEEALEEAQAAAGTPLPAAEVYYLPSLPRRVDDVTVSRGDLAENAVMSVSGAELEVVAQVDEADRQLLTEEMEVILDLPTGEATGTITEIRAPDGQDEGGEEGGEQPAPDGYQVVITPEELTPDQVDEVRETNVRVRVPIESTDGEVMAVPLAALTAGPGGESRVEVQRAGGTELVEVTVGLVAEGYAEVTAVDGLLAPGDLVVVGESALEGEAPGTEPSEAEGG